MGELKDMFKFKKVYLFGAGRLGRIICDTLKEYVLISGFIDNDRKKQKKKILGYNVYALNDVINIQANIMIIVTTNQHSLEVVRELEGYNLTHFENYMYYKDFFQFIYETSGRLMQGYLEIYLTNKCTLKCKACALMVPYTEQKIDVEIDELKNDIEAYFDLVDEVIEFRILGGEPFLYEKIDEFILFLCNSFSEKIHQIKIVTNGTVLPASSTLLLLSEYHVQVDISDYPCSLAKLQRSRLLCLLDRYMINYIVMPMQTWIDTYGNPKEKKHVSDHEVRQLFKECNFGCRTIYKKRLYYCAIDCAAQRGKIIEGNKEDYFDLSSKKDVKKMKKNLLDFDLGKIQRGYVSFCKNCNGGIGSNKKFIPVAEQLRGHGNDEWTN